MPPKQYTERDIEVAERLTGVEVRLGVVDDRLGELDERLQIVHNDLVDHRSESQRRSDELKELINKIGGQIDSDKFRWASILTKDNAKILVYIVLSMSGLAGGIEAAKTLLP